MTFLVSRKGKGAKKGTPDQVRGDGGQMARLKGLDEFEKPEFVGRMARIARRKKLEWWAMMAAAFALGCAIGWMLIQPAGSR